MNKNNKLGLLVLIPAVLLALVGIGFFSFDLLLSMENYKPRLGLFGSEFVGMMNFEKLFGSFTFWHVVPNSIVQTLLLIAVSVPGAMLISFLVGLIPVRPLKAAVAGGALLLALAPSLMWTDMALDLTKWLRDALLSQGIQAGHSIGYDYWTNFIIANVVPQTALCVFAGLAMNLSGKTNAALGVLVAGLVPALTLLMPDMQMNLMLGNAMNYASSDTIPHYVYRIGLQNIKFAFASAASVFGKAVSLVIGVVPALAIAWISGRGCSPDRVREERYSWIFEALAALGVAVLMTAVVVVPLVLGKPLWLAENSAYNYLITLIIMLIVMPMAFIYSLIVLFASRKADKSILCVLGFAVMILAMSQLSVFTINHYLLARSTGALNTFAPVVTSVLGNPLFVTLLIVLAALKPVTVRQTIFLALGAAALAGACAAGEWFGGMIYVMDREMMPFGTYLRTLLMSGSAVLGADAPAEAVALVEATKNGSMALYVGTCLVVGIPAVALTMAGVGGTRIQGETK